MSTDNLVVTSELNVKGRGMELSDLCLWQGRLYTCDDKTGELTCGPRLAPPTLSALAAGALSLRTLCTRQDRAACGCGVGVGLSYLRHTLA